MAKLAEKDSSRQDDDEEEELPETIAGIEAEEGGFPIERCS